MTRTSTASRPSRTSRSWSSDCRRKSDVSVPEIVVTGLGCVSPFGEGVAAFTAGLRTGRPSESPRTFDPAGYRNSGVYHAAAAGLSPQSRNRPAELAEKALAEAFAQAGLASGTVRAAGLAMASTSAGWHLPDETLDPAGPALDAGADTLALRKEGPAYWLAERWRLDGPHVTISSACASATGALAWAAERIRNGEAPVMAAGAVDVLTEVVFAGFHSMRLLSTTTRPFARDRSGFVLAEGAAFLVLEDADHARARGAEVLAVLAGWGASSDAAHITTPSAEGIARSLRGALADAGRGPEEIAVYHAHGTASVASDAAEASAVAEVLRPSGGRMAVTATKSGCGHTEGAAGLFSAIAAVDAIRTSQLPPVLGVDEPDPAFEVLDLARGTAPADSVAPAVVHASGFGGVNCTVVLDRPGRQRVDALPPRRKVLVHLAAQSSAEQPVRLAAFGDPIADETRNLGEPQDPAFARSPAPDRVTELLGATVGALLGAVGPDTAQRVRSGGLLTGTAFGGQANHGRMQSAIRGRGGRTVDPLDFARSTFNVPASQCSSAFGITGRLEAFLGATGGVEALLSAAEAVATGREQAVLAAGYDAPENRLWRYEKDPDVPAAATALLLGTPQAASAGSIVELAAFRRVAPTSRARSAAALLAAIAEVDRQGAADEVWLDPAGLEEDTVSQLLAGLASPHVVATSEPGAASPLDGHLRALTRLVSGDLTSLTVVTTAECAPSAVVRYQRTDRV
ncbi:beta-ketoacyl synthase N-terminal-like domain-containing protein [Streptomyces sp. NPDC088915]|uniref:beta-ketoacyl synthase N-terminal-like domain-containing protein n=1 Tax=Streptomyces sp. NPDC088915 TaxID=3365912 RepID=UPI00381111FF